MLKAFLLTIAYKASPVCRSLAQLGSRSQRKSSTDFLSWLPMRSRSRYGTQTRGHDIQAPDQRESRGAKVHSIVPSSMGATVHKLSRKYHLWVNVSPVSIKFVKQIAAKSVVNFKEKPTFRVRCLYSSFVHAPPPPYLTKPKRNNDSFPSPFHSSQWWWPIRMRQLAQLVYLFLIRPVFYVIFKSLCTQVEIPTRRQIHGKFTVVFPGCHKQVFLVNENLFWTFFYILGDLEGIGRKVIWGETFFFHGNAQMFGHVRERIVSLWLCTRTFL
jgi:hypothetical protein